MFFPIIVHTANVRINDTRYLVTKWRNSNARHSTPTCDVPTHRKPSGLTCAGRASCTIFNRRLHYAAEKNACELACERVRSPTRLR